MPLIPDANNGNSPIITYHLEMDDGQGGPFTTIAGEDPFSLTTTHTITENIMRGYTYQFRYRTRNSAGWSGYSSIAYITAARVPEAPAAPKFNTASSTSITLDFSESLDNGGSSIQSYELWMDTGVLGSTFSQITQYNDNSMQHTVDNTNNGITSGTTYGFKFKAVNAVGDSAFSAESRFAAATAPA